MSNIFFELGVQKGIDSVLEKEAAGNPAQPQKSSKGGMETSDGPSAAYLNQGGGKAGPQGRAGGRDGRV